MNIRVESRQIVAFLTVAVALCLCLVAEGQACRLCWQPDTTLLDYKMVAGTEYTIVGGRVVWHNLSLDFTNVDSQTIIAVYAKLSGLELVVDSQAKMIHTPISVQAYELTQRHEISLIETALKEQAGIVITSVDDKRAAVTYDKTLPIKKSKD